MPKDNKKVAKELQLVIQGKRDGSIHLNIQNGGAAAKMFLLETEGTSDKVITAKAYPQLIADNKVARSKRGLSKGMSSYQSQKAVIKPAQKDEVVKEVVENFIAMQKLAVYGRLKATWTTVKKEIIPLS